MTESTQSPLYRLVAEKTGQDTVEWMRERRERGISWRGISMALLSEHGLDVTEVTLRKWWSQGEQAAS